MNSRNQAIRCGVCLIVFSVPESFINQVLEGHRQFYCPSGHALMFREQRPAPRRGERKDDSNGC